MKDIVYALRMLRRNPGFTAITVGTIALGIGACTAIFTVVNAVLLRPLPYQNPERLVLVWSELRTRNVLDFPFPIPDVRDLRTHTTAFDGIAAISGTGRVAMGEDGSEPEQVRSIGATTNLFQVLGVAMVAGRDFVEADGVPLPPPQGPPAPGAAPVPPPPAIISNGLWRRRFGGDASVVGKIVRFGNGRAEIVGVLPADFELLFPPRTGIEPNIDVWTALRLNFDTAARGTGVLRVIGRMKPETTLQRAQADADAVAAMLREQFPVKKNVDLHFRVVPMHKDLVGDVQPTVLMLFGSVVFVLLIACANVANLLVVRASARQRELVIRSAIGGSRSRLVRQLLTETVVLAGLGGALGVVLADAGVSLLAPLAPSRLPRGSAIRVDAAVLWFSVAATVLTAAMCGIVPALRASRQQAADVLRATGMSAGLRAGRRLRYGVVIAEVAIAFVLLIGSGLMLRSNLALLRVDPGYDPNNVLTFFRAGNRPQAEARAELMRQVRDRVKAIPGVVSVASANPLPLDGGTQNIPWATEEAGAGDPSAFRQANFRYVTPGYFETMKAKLLDGRVFTDADNVVDQAHKVVVDNLVAARAFPTGSAVGRTLLVRNLQGGGPNAPTNNRVEIIGVVRHQRHETLAEDGRETIFFVDAYSGFGAAARWTVRTAGAPESIVPAVRAALLEIDPRVPAAEIQSMSALVDKSNGTTRFAGIMIGVFGAIGLLLAVVGLYGVLSTVVRLRTSEIGLRMVCGALPSGVLRLVMLEGVRLSIVGIAIGLVAALSMTNLIRAMLVGTTPTDPLTFAAMTAVFLLVAVVASLIPARRAAALDPLAALRQD